jgi:hypothetical protein
MKALPCAMSSQFPALPLNMCMGSESGCQAVPEEACE